MGEQTSMSESQRKGQFLYNKLRENSINSPNEQNVVANRLWNMTNEEFDKILRDY